MSEDNDNEIDYRQMYPVSGRKGASRHDSRLKEKPEPEPIRAQQFARRITPQKTPTPADHQYEPDRPRKKLILVAKALLANNPDISLADMKEELDAMGYNISATTISGIRQDFYETIRIAQKARYIRLLR